MGPPGMGPPPPGMGPQSMNMGPPMGPPGMGPPISGMGSTPMGPPGTGMGPPGTGMGPPGSGMGPPRMPPPSSMMRGHKAMDIGPPGMGPPPGMQMGPPGWDNQGPPGWGMQGHDGPPGWDDQGDDVEENDPEDDGPDPMNQPPGLPSLLTMKIDTPEEFRNKPQPVGGVVLPKALEEALAYKDQRQAALGDEADADRGTNNI